MNLSEINALVNDYADALQEEYDSRIFAGQVEAGWFNSGQVDGKNAEARAAQMAELEFSSVPHKKAAEASIRAAVLREEIGLTKAWLYSQSAKL